MKHISYDRLAKFRSYMENNGYDFFIIYTADDHLSEYISECDKFREYLTGFTGSAGTLVVSKEEVLIWVDGRYYIQAEQELKGSEIKIMKYGESGVPSVNGYLKEKCVIDNICAVDSRNISTNALKKLKEDLPSYITITAADDVISNIWQDRPLRKFNTISFRDISLTGKSSKDKLTEIRANIENKFKRIDYSFIVSDLTSIMWITNLRGSDIQYVPVAFSYLIITRCDAVLFCKLDKISDDIKTILLEAGISCIEYDEFYIYLKSIKEKLCIFDYNKNNSLIENELFKTNTVKHIDEFLLIRKDIKNETELYHMKKHHITDAIAMIKFIYKIKKLSKENNLPNEIEAADVLNDFRLKSTDCYDLSFETISAYGKNAALPHYSADKYNCSKLYPKGFYLVDSGGQYNSCTTDITRTIALGELTQKEKECYTAVLKGNLDLMDAIFLEGCTGENLDILARSPIWNLGLDYRHGTGHGIGCELSVHEGPLAIRYRIVQDKLQPPLAKGMVVSNEPGIYLEDEFGIRLENELFIIEKEKNKWGTFLGFESLTYVPFELEAVIPEKLTERERDILNSYHKVVYEILNEYLSYEEQTWLKENTMPI